MFLSINMVEGFSLLSKVGIDLGIGRNLLNRFLEWLMMYHEEHEAAVAAFIRNNGITRCPTACALPTQASPGLADRIALQRYAARRNRCCCRQDRRSKRWPI